MSMFAEPNENLKLEPDISRFIPIGPNVKALNFEGGLSTVSTIQVISATEAVVANLTQTTAQPRIFERNMVFETYGQTDEVLNEGRFIFSDVVNNEGETAPLNPGELIGAYETLDPVPVEQLDAYVNQKVAIVARVQNMRQSMTKKNKYKMTGNLTGLRYPRHVKFLWFGGLKYLTCPCDLFLDDYCVVPGLVEVRKGQLHVLVNAKAGVTHLYSPLQAHVKSSWVPTIFSFAFFVVITSENGTKIPPSPHVLAELRRYAQAMGCAVYTDVEFLIWVEEDLCHRDFMAIGGEHCDLQVYASRTVKCGSCSERHLLRRPQLNLGPSTLYGRDVKVSISGSKEGANVFCASQYFVDMGELLGLPGRVEVNDPDGNGYPEGGEEFIGEAIRRSIRVNGRIGLKTYTVEGEVRVSMKPEIMGIEDLVDEKSVTMWSDRDAGQNGAGAGAPAAGGAAPVVADAQTNESVGSGSGEDLESAVVVKDALCGESAVPGNDVKADLEVLLEHSRVETKGKSEMTDVVPTYANVMETKDEELLAIAESFVAKTGAAAKDIVDFDGDIEMTETEHVGVRRSSRVGKRTASQSVASAEVGSSKKKLKREKREKKKKSRS